MRIRQGNDFIFLWAIERSGEPEDFSNAVNIRLHFKNFDCVGEVKSFQIVDGNIVRVEVSPEWASNLGAYRLILSYEFEDLSLSDGDRKCVVDVLAFNIVPKTSEADDVTEMAKTTDIMIGLKGDKGDPFTYDDFTPEQIEDLKRPAIEAAESVLIVENQITLNEQGRVQAENERETAELTRQSSESERNEAEGLRVNAESSRDTAENSRDTAESLRVEAESLRQLSTQEAISNAENATENANTAAQNADDARLAIQDDLALKANHGYESNPKTLKEVNDDLVQLGGDVSDLRDDATVKIENLVVNGDFRNGPTGWSNYGGGTFVIENGYIKYTPISIAGAMSNGIKALSAGDMWYIKSVMKSDSNVNCTAGFAKSGAGIRVIPYTSIGTSDTTMSGIVTVENVSINELVFGRPNVIQPIYIKSASAINLTTTFGAGNEPTKEEFELLLATLGIDYFEGEITIPAQKIMQWQLKLIRKNKNAIIALGGTII